MIKLKIILLCAFFVSCNLESDYDKKRDINTIKYPLVVIARCKESIIIKTADGYRISYEATSPIGDALIACFDVGDTIK